jgi:transglutaminase-like putative cysteine protease
VSFRRVSWYVCFCLFLALAAENYSPFTVHAGIGFQPIDPQELKMTGEPLAPGAPAIILYRQVDRDDNGFTSHEDNYERIKILTEDGRKYADVEIPFVKGSNDVVHLRARSIHPDGSIAEYDGQVFEKEIVKARGLRYMAKTFTLPDVQVGSIIEYFFTYDFKEYSLYDSNWILSQDLFTKSARFSLKPYQGNLRNPFTVSWRLRVPPGTTPPKEGPDRIIRLEAQDIAAFQVEDFMPPENELKFRVNFVYSDDAYEPDQDKYWKKVDKKLDGQVEGFVGKPRAMEAAVARIVAPGDTPEQKLRKLYDRVQSLRNTSYELEKTEQEEKRENEKPPTSVEEVWKRGYANGVQLTWLYLGLVRAAGFEAYPVMISDRRNYFFRPQSMDRSKLDANVVLVKLNGKDLYFEPGVTFTPFGLLEWPETSVQGLKLDKDGGSWVQTPITLSSDSRVEHKAKLQLLETGDLEGKVTVIYTGLEAMSRRMHERHNDDTAKKKYLEEQVEEYIPVAAELDLTNQPDWKTSSQPLVAEFSLKIPGWVSGAGRRALVPVGIFSAPEKHIFEHANRVHPLYFEYPSQKVDDITIDLPLGWQVQSLPKPQKQDGHVVTYDLVATNDAGSLHVRRTLTVDMLLLDQKYYGALRNFFQGVRTGDEEQIVLQPGNASAQN